MRRAVWAAVSGAAAGFVAWVLGLHVLSAAIVGLAVGVAVLAIGRLDLSLEPGGPYAPVREHAGARRDAQELAWAMDGRSGYVGRRPALRLRAAAAHRLARHGLVLGSDDDAADIRALLGPRAAAVLAAGPSAALRASEFQAVLAALERIGPGERVRSALVVPAKSSRPSSSDRSTP
jgi:hypothetical protein